MSHPLEMILKLVDKFTPQMKMATSVSESSAVKIQAQFDKIGMGGKRMSSSVNELREKLDGINKVRFSTTLKNEFDQSTRAARKLEQQIEKLENHRQNRGSGIGSILTTAAIGYGARDILKTGIQQQQISGAINFATEGQGSAAISQAKGINNKYGLSDEAGLQGLKTITGSTRGLGYSLQQQMDIYEGVGTGVAAMGLSADSSKLSFLALGQMASKGVVSSEELRQQLGEHIPGALGIAARAMGMTQANFSKMLDEGKIMSKDFLPKFAAQMKNEFGPSALAMAKGPQAELNRFNNKLLEIKTTFSDKLLPAFMPVLGVLKDLMDWFTRNKEVMVPLAIGITGVVLAANAWSVATKAAAFFTGAWTVATNILNAALWKSPVTWIVIGIIALIAAIGYIIYITDGWGKQWDSVVNFLKFSWAAFKDFFLIQWLEVQNGFMKGIEIIEKGWYHLKSLWDEEGAQAGLSKINDQQNARANEIALSKGQLTKNLSAAQDALKYELHLNGKGMGTMVTDIKKKLGIGGSLTVAGGGGGTGGGGTGGGVIDGGKTKSDSINSGGQRSVVIHIGKQIEKLEVHVMNAKEGAQEIESAVRDAMRRVLYSMNGVATN